MAVITIIRLLTYDEPTETEQAEDEATVKGPYRNNYEVTTNLGIASAVWSPCHGVGVAS